MKSKILFPLVANSRQGDRDRLLISVSDLLGMPPRNNPDDPIIVKVQYPDNDVERRIRRSEFLGPKYRGRLEAVSTELLKAYRDATEVKVTEDNIERCYNLQLAGNFRWDVGVVS